MSRITSTILALGLLAASSVYAQDADTTAVAADSSTIARSYWTLGGLYYASNNDYDLMVIGGQAWPLGANGGWTVRAGIGTGVTFYGLNDTGFILGPQLALERVLTGDRIEISRGQPLELYALIGGAAYSGWNLEESTGGRTWVPAVSGGVGLRFRAKAASDPMVTLELYYEERFADFDPRLFIRFDYMHPRGRAN